MKTGTLTMKTGTCLMKGVSSTFFLRFRFFSPFFGDNGAIVKEMTILIQLGTESGWSCFVFLYHSLNLMAMGQTLLREEKLFLRLLSKV